MFLQAYTMTHLTIVHALGTHIFRPLNQSSFFSWFNHPRPSPYSHVLFPRIILFHYRTQHTLVADLVIPIHCFVGYFRTRGRKAPVEIVLDILHQMARQFDMSNIRWMPHWIYIIVLEDPRRIEVMHKRLLSPRKIRSTVEVFVHIVDLRNVRSYFSVGCSAFLEAVPKGLWTI